MGKNIKCLECQAEINLDEDLQKGEVVTCPDCSTDFEVISTVPIKIKLAPAVEEDWGQ